MSITAALAAFGAVTLTALLIEIVYTYATQGFAYGFSSNRATVERTALGLRIERAYRNQVESAAYIVPVLVAGALAGLDGAGVSLAAALIVAGRAAFVLLYYTGLPFARILGFGCGSMGSLYLVYRLIGALSM